MTDKKKTIEEFFTQISDSVEFFNDQQGVGYIRFSEDGHKETWPCRSKQVRLWVGKEYLEAFEILPGRDVVKRVIEMLESKALYDGANLHLYNRVGAQNEDIWYDLGNRLWQGIRVTKNGWYVDDLPILFRRYAHQKPQVYPLREDTDVKKFLEYVNVSDPDHQMLLLVALITAFIPDIAHPILIVHGPQGSAKSVQSKFNTEIIDPSKMEAATFPKNSSELIQMLNHHWAIFFDNISSLDQEDSDMLCRAVTGVGFSKRELYSDSDDIIWNFKRVIGLNGINQVVNRPDLLERSVLIELERIPQNKRVSEYEIMTKFKKDLPAILGGIFDTLVKAMNIKPDIKVDNLPRMADFTLWGCAVAEALGFSQQAFLSAYLKNIDSQDEAIVADNIVANVLMSFMLDKKDWEGSPTECFVKFTDHAEMVMGIRIRSESSFPKNPGWLMRELNRIKISLEKANYRINSKIKNSQRTVEITNLNQNADNAVITP